MKDRVHGLFPEVLSMSHEDTNGRSAPGIKIKFGFISQFSNEWSKYKKE